MAESVLGVPTGIVAAMGQLAATHGIPGAPETSPDGAESDGGPHDAEGATPGARLTLPPPTRMRKHRPTRRNHLPQMRKTPLLQMPRARL